MLRINQIIKILSDMKPYAPYTYKSKTDKLIDKIHGKLLAIVIIFMSSELILNFASHVFIFVVFFIKFF